MPTYIYECPDACCENTAQTEVEQSAADLDNPNSAPLCCVCELPMRRIIQPVGIAFKGPGFYVNDHGH